MLTKQKDIVLSFRNLYSLLHKQYISTEDTYRLLVGITGIPYKRIIELVNKVIKKVTPTRLEQVHWAVQHKNGLAIRKLSKYHNLNKGIYYEYANTSEISEKLIDDTQFEKEDYNDMFEIVNQFRKKAKIVGGIADDFF